MAAALAAQFPQPDAGQYPPGGGYPDQYPGGSRLPIPIPRLPGGRTSTDHKIPLQFSGTVQSVAADSFIIVEKDKRIITFQCTGETNYFGLPKSSPGAAAKGGDGASPGAKQGSEDSKPSKTTKPAKRGKRSKADEVPPEIAMGWEQISLADLKAGDGVDVEAWPDGDNFTARKVFLREPAPPSAARKDPAHPDDDAAGRIAGVELTPAPPDPDDPGPPKVRRGVPKPRPSRSRNLPGPPVSTAEPAVTLSRPAASTMPDKARELLDRARQFVTSYDAQLPNYICQQITTRFQGEGRPIQWQPVDVVTASLVYDGGKESYQNIKIGGKAHNKPMEELPGGWSKGEFGTILQDLFSPSTAAAFRYRKESTASGLAASVFDFKVEQPNSHWLTIIGGQSLYPAYQGSVWIDKKGARVLRIEMQARQIPDSFPLHTIETTLDYAMVRIGASEFLLPAHSANLSCWRSSMTCNRNTLDFRNYRKFTSESQILMTDSDIQFEGEAPPPATPEEKSGSKK